MSHGKTAMMLMAALALPRAADALGLGEIHVESALNEPLAAEIDLVGVTDEDLSGITASIANRDTFQRFGIDRPAFLSSMEFKIARGAGGRAVLAVRSKDSFNEPAIDLLVDLRWHGGEAVRQYTLLMDPPGMSQATRPAAVAAPAPVAAPVPVPVAASASASAITPGTIKVGPRATLRSVVARHLGVRGDAERTRMMIALFHANPSAFEGNINRLRRGSVLSVPSTADLAAISVADARREFHSQMQAWRGGATVASRSAASQSLKAAALSSEPAIAPPAHATVPPIVAVAPSAVAASAEDAGALDRRVQTLEKGLRELQELLDRERDKLIRVQATLVHEQKAAGITAAPPPKHNAWQMLAWPLATASALLIGWFAAFRLGRRRPADSMPQNSAPNTFAAYEPAVSTEPAPAPPADVASRTTTAPAVAGNAAATRIPTAAPPAPEPQALESEAPEAANSDTQFAAKLAALGVFEGIDVESLEASYVLESSQNRSETHAISDADTAILASADTAKLASADTAKLVSADTGKLVALGTAANGEDPNAETMPVETVQLPVAVESTQLDYNLVDLDSTAHHVQMPSRLHESVGFKERRTSLVDALKLAIEREPNRRDLRMKLLETYFAAAATNRKGFLELVRSLAADLGESGEDWNKIVQMGRQIASDSELFAAEAAGVDDKDLKNCA